MRLVRNTLQFMLSFLLAFSVYALPLFSLILGGIMPDPEDVVVEQEPYRDVSLADAGPLLDQAFLPNQSEQADPTPMEPQVAPPPEPQKAPPPKPEPAQDAPSSRAELAQDPPPQQKQVDQLAKEIALARRQQLHDKAENLAKQRAEARAAAEARKASHAKGGGKKQKCADPTPGIAQMGDREFTIPREVVLHYANDLDAAARLAWVAWAENDRGKVDGFSVKHIRCGSVLDQAGLKNGDVIHAVNGKSVTSILQAFGAWRKVRKKDVVRIQVSRKDQRFEIRYHIE